MAAGATYEPIATTTIGSNTTITFTNIPSTYTDLVAVFNGGITADYWSLVCRLNSDSGSNYSSIYLLGTNGVYVERQSNSSYAVVGGGGFGFPVNSLTALSIIQFMNYANTTTNKTILSRSGHTTTGVNAAVSLWRSTSAITSIQFLSSASGGTTNLVSGTSITLYGIAAA